MLEPIVDDPVIEEILAIQEGQGEDFWSFRNASKRQGAHALIHYPAMMVPNLQGNLLEAIQRACPNATSVLDPFVGSGTILVESMDRGLDFTGVDINPLAILACAVKGGPYFVDALKEKVKELNSRVLADKRQEYYVSFQGRDKWFQDDVSLSISRLARCIELESAKWARRLFWLSLARVVRASCNSRMSTYKLHIKKNVNPEIGVDPISLFHNSVSKLMLHMDEQYKAWCEKGLMKSGRYIHNINLKLGDSICELKKKSNSAKFDIIMTSPPYGDNRTTIPYGQYAYLPMKWIPTCDVSEGIDDGLLASTHAIDTASLGGSIKGAAERGAALCEKYESAKMFSGSIKTKRDAYKRFSSFFGDLDDSVGTICDATAQGGYHAWTIGNRRIAGKRVPMEDILAEMLQQRGVAPVGLIRRRIHAKKMAARNNISETMNTETIVIARKL